MRNKGMLVGAALATVLGLALAGCGEGKPTINEDAAGDWVTSTPPADGPVDDVAWALPYGEPSSLHWLRAVAYSDSTVLSSLCESLLRLTPEFTYEPGIATFEAPDDTTFVYTLRDGVTFTDGTPVTAEDVVYSLSANLDPKVGSFWGDWFTNVEAIEATGEGEVTVRLGSPDAMFNPIMATAAGIVVKKEFVESQGDDYGTSAGGVMCTGPFALEEWVPGTSIQLTRSEHYWDADHQPLVENLGFEFITNASTLTDALRAGEIDGSYEVPFSAIAALTDSDAGELYFGESLGFAEMVFYAKDGLGQDQRVREALSLALDRDGMIESVFAGAGRPVWSPFFEATWGDAADVYGPAWDDLAGESSADLDAARALLEDVDAEESLRLLSNADDPPSKRLAAYVKSQAQEIGLEVELVELPAAQYIATAFDPERQLEYDLGIGTSSYLDIPEPALWAAFTIKAGGWFNSLGYDNPEVDALVDAARTEVDPGKRAELMVEAQQQAWGEDVVSVPLVQTASVMFMNERITGANPTLNAHLYYPWARDLGAAP